MPLFDPALFDTLVYDTAQAVVPSAFINVGPPRQAPIVRPREPLRQFTLAAASGQVRVTGTPATLRVHRVVSAVAAIHPAPESAASLRVVRRMVAEAGHVSVFGDSARLGIHPAPPAPPPAKALQKPQRVPLSRRAIFSVVTPSACDAMDTAWLALQRERGEEEEELILLGVVGS